MKKQVKQRKVAVKVTDELEMQIQNAIHAGMPYKEIAKKFNVHIRTVNNVKKRETEKEQKINNVRHLPSVDPSFVADIKELSPQEKAELIVCEGFELGILQIRRNIDYMNLHPMAMRAAMFPEDLVNMLKAVAPFVLEKKSGKSNADDNKDKGNLRDMNKFLDQFKPKKDGTNN